MIALLFEDLKYKRLIRSLLIIPYPVPVLVSIMVWRALFNENMGLVTTAIANIFGFSPRFFTNAAATRFALILINVYLSYPYFYVLSSGALKSISGDLFEAAAIDGAGPFTVVRKIVLPQVMRILAPLVIASFCFNFNNFTLVWGFNSGLPAMADTAVPMGHTDLLISFIYRLGFSSSNAADYGFSAAITVLLFIVVALMVFFQTLNTKTMKEVR
jgi:ABC-type sugar transport system permease subunit